MEEESSISNISEQLARRSFPQRVDYIAGLVADPNVADKALESVIEHPQMEEVIFNVINHFCLASKKGEIEKKILERCEKLGELRMAHLKKQFTGKPSGRDIPGKMEYDTTLDSIRGLNKMLSDRK